MKNIRIYLIALSALVLTLSCFAEAQAQLGEKSLQPLDRTFVSTTGTDSLSCGAQHLPCRDFNAALSRTYPGGIVIALDSGIYAASNITIHKAVTLTAAPGVHAELYNTDAGERILVNAGPNDLVVLRNLYITAKPGGTGYGVFVVNVGTLQIENCVFDRFGIGILLVQVAQFFMKDTIIRNCPGTGMIVTPTQSGLTRVMTIDHCQFVNNFDGLSIDGNYPYSLDGNCRVDVRDSVATGNAEAGFRIDGGDVGLDHCDSSHNRFGVLAPGGTVTVSNSFVTDNRDFGFVNFGGVFHSLGNNVVRRNGQNTSGTITVISGT